MVIQRLQNLYLFLSAVLLLIFAFTTSVIVEVGTKIVTFSCIKMCGIPDGGETYVPISIVLVALSVILSVLAIAKFKDLKVQKSVTLRTMFCVVALVAYIFINVSVIADTHSVLSIKPTFLRCLPLLALILQFMALNGIKRDIKLLRDSDHIR